MSEPRKAVISALVWLGGQAAIGRIISFLLQMALAWTLLPADFGRIGLASTIAALVFAPFVVGLDDVLLQRHTSASRWIAAMTRIGFAVGGIGTLILIVFAVVAETIFADHSIGWMVAVLATATPAKALTTIPVAILRRDLRYDLVSKANLAEDLSQAILSVILALSGFGAFSVVLPYPVTSLAKLIGLWVAVGSDLRRTIGTPVGRTRWRRILPASMRVVAIRLLDALIGSGDYLVLGLLVPLGEVGLYYLAYRLSFQARALIAGATTSVQMSLLVRDKNDPDRQMERAFNASVTLAWIVTPLCALQVSLAAPLLTLALPAAWRGTAPYIEILSIGLYFDAGGWVAMTLLRARGDFARVLQLYVSSTLIFFTLVVPGGLFGASRGVAMAVALHSAIIGPVIFVRSFSGSQRPLQQRLKQQFLWPAVAAAATIGLARLGCLSLGIDQPLIIIAAAATGALAYGLIWFAVRGQACRFVAKRLKL